jgi:hypothetical protein
MSAADLRDRFSRFDHPSWLTAAGTAASYLAVLALMFVVLFVVPFLVFLLLA